MGWESRHRSCADAAAVTRAVVGGCLPCEGLRCSWLGCLAAGLAGARAGCCAAGGLCFPARPHISIPIPHGVREPGSCSALGSLCRWVPSQSPGSQLLTEAN